MHNRASTRRNVLVDVEHNDRVETAFDLILVEVLYLEANPSFFAKYRASRGYEPRDSDPLPGFGPPGGFARSRMMTNRSRIRRRVHSSDYSEGHRPRSQPRVRFEDSPGGNP